MISKVQTLLVFLVALLVAPLVGCGDSDDDNGSTGPGAVSKTFTVTIENESGTFDFFGSGVFDTPMGESAPAPIGPGQAYEFEFGAAPGAVLSFATMFVHSNDLFYAPDGDGIALFDGAGSPVSGDVTDQVFLWDAGTEMNEEPGVGANQAPRQTGANTGADDADATVRLVSDGFTYPAAADVIRVTVTPQGGNEFTVRIENVSVEGTLMTSDSQSLAVPLAPGVYVIHSDASADPLFTAGSTMPAAGLEALAEDGSPSGLGATIAANTGYNTPFAPGAYVVHSEDAVLFEDGMSNGGYGLEALAEDGDPSGLATYLGSLDDVSMSGSFSVPDGGSTGAPIHSGESYSFTFTATEGDRLSLATMLVQSNDLFVAFDDGGIQLFDAGGNPASGNFTSAIRIWDAGTEMNQWPGAGPDQAPRQSGANTGAADATDAVRQVDDSYVYPGVSELIKVTITVVD